jgi:hypothetical protein
VRHGGRPRRRAQDAPRDLESAATEQAAQPIEAGQGSAAGSGPDLALGAEAQPVPNEAPPTGDDTASATEAESDATVGGLPIREPEAEPEPEAEAVPAVDVVANSLASPELVAGSYVPLGAPPLGLSSALAVEFGRSIEASWASAEPEEVDEPARPEVPTEPEVAAEVAGPEAADESHEPAEAGPEAVDESHEPAEAEPDQEVEPAHVRDDPAVQVRLARVHLRTGGLTLARAEFEKLAGLGYLDAESMLDLAEVRWRTGDLARAGTAANAYLAGGGDDALGFVIAAEAASVADRPADARRYAGRALERSHVGLETYFAGIPRRLTWPHEAGIEATPAVAVVGDANETDEGRLSQPEAPRLEAEPLEVPAPRQEAPSVLLESATPPPAADARPEPTAAPDTATGQPTVPPPAVPTLPAASSVTVAAPGGPDIQPESELEVRLGIAALESEDALLAGLHFGVALRLTPSAATAVLDAIGDRRGLPLELVRGDALRLLGHMGAADEAYLSVAAELRAPGPAPEPAEVEPPAPEPAEVEPPAPEPAEVEPPAPEPAEVEPPAPEPLVSEAPEPETPPEPPLLRWETPDDL